MTTPTPINQPRSPLATGDEAQKVRFDAVAAVLDKSRPALTAGDVLDLAYYIETGDLPEEDA